jgi:hypothetical protein
MIKCFKKLEEPVIMMLLSTLVKFFPFDRVSAKDFPLITVNATTQIDRCIHWESSCCKHGSATHVKLLRMTHGKYKTHTKQAKDSKGTSMQ